MDTERIIALATVRYRENEPALLRAVRRDARREALRAFLKRLTGL
jgi:hypothetical protein